MVSVRRPPRRRVVVLAAAAALGAAAAVALVLALRGDGVDEDGPLEGSSVRQGSGFPVDAGEPLTYAAIAVFNPGVEPIVLEEVALVDPDPGVRLVGALAAPRPEGPFIVAYSDFPPSRTQYAPEFVGYPQLEAIEGFVVPPQPGAVAPDAAETQLYVGLESTEPAGRVTLESFRLYYRVGERRYVRVVPQTVSLCSPRAEYYRKKPCETFLPGDR